MGRPSLDIEREQLIGLWKELKTAPRIAERLNCHPQTVKNYSRKFGIEGLTPGYKRGYSPINSSFAKWLAKYRGPLPKSQKELIELSGCSRWAVVSYMYRLRRDARELINRQLWRHNGPPVVWKDIKGVKVPDRAFDVVRANISRFGSMEFKVKLRTGGVHIFRFTINDFRHLYEQ